jgi:hypothetical protein
MRKLGGYLFIFGLGSIVLHFANMEFIILAWIDLWGESAAWAIRIGMTVIGGVLWLIGSRSSEPEA